MKPFRGDPFEQLASCLFDFLQGGALEIIIPPGVDDAILKLIEKLLKLGKNQLEKLISADVGRDADILATCTSCSEMSFTLFSTMFVRIDGHPMYGGSKPIGDGKCGGCHVAEACSRCDF